MPYYTDEQPTVNNAPAGGSRIATTPKKSLADQIAELNAQNTSENKALNIPNFQSYSPDYKGLDTAFKQMQAGYDQLRTASQSQYEADKAREGTNLESTMRGIADTKETVGEGFAESKKQIATDSFMADRAIGANMSSRGLTGSGIQALATIQNRMATGENISDLANDFFDAQEQLVNAEVDAKNNYNNSLSQLNANLQNTLASIMNGQASNEMQYRQQVESMKQSVIESANNAKAMQYQYEQARQELEEGQKITQTMVQSTLESTASTEFKKKALIDMGFSPAQAEQAVGDYESKTTSDAQTQVQNQVYAWKALDYSDADIKVLLGKLLNEQGVKFDPAKIVYKVENEKSTPRKQNLYADMTGATTVPTGASYNVTPTKPFNWADVTKKLEK